MAKWLTELRFPARYHEKISYQEYMVLLCELSRKNVKQALSGVRMAPAATAATTYRWVEIGPRDEKTAEEEAHRRVGHLYCGFAEGQEPAYEYLQAELPRLADSLKILPIAVEDKDPR